MITELNGRVDQHKNHQVILMTTMFRVKVNQAQAGWADEIITLLKNKHNTENL